VHCKTVKDFRKEKKLHALEARTLRKPPVGPVFSRLALHLAVIEPKKLAQSLAELAPYSRQRQSTLKCLASIWGDTD
jgi:hypothetical protein